MIFLTVSLITVTNVDALRVRVLNFISEIGEKSTTIHINHGEANYDSFDKEVQGMYLPAFIPQGFVIESVNKVNEYYLVTYKNDTGTKIELERLPSGSSVGIDIEESQTEQIMINDELAQYFLKNGLGNLIFKYKENAFLISAPISRNELIKMAESLEYIK